MNPLSELTHDWRYAGIEPGDVVLVHMSCKRTFQRYAERGRHIEPSDILQSFLEAVGPRGTVLFPTFNWGFCEGMGYDIRKTPSHMGVVTECARLHPDAVRNGHPAYSFATIGMDADAFGMDNFQGLGKGSPFHTLYQMGGKVASLDLTDQYGMTFYHHIDAMLEVDWRFFKIFTGPYTREDGATHIRNYGIYVRRRSLGVVTDLDNMMELLWGGEVYTGWRPGVGAGLRVADCRTMFDFIKAYIEDKQADGLLFHIDHDAVMED